MILEHYGLIEEPFGVTPDPRFLHLSLQHREAIATLFNETDSNRGFLALIGPPGTGKTSLLLNYLESLRHRARTAYLFHNASTPRELMRYLLADLGIDARGQDLPGMHGTLNRILEDEMHAGRRVVLVIDEAQNLAEKVLEFIRLLSNFETPWAKLLHIVLAGQPQLAERLALPSMAQLRQRISSIIRLAPLTAEETVAYIYHRLWVAGYEGPPLFSPAARLLIVERSGGIPRNINNLCFHSMLLAYANGDRHIDGPRVKAAIADLFLEDTFRQLDRQEIPARSQTRAFPRTSGSLGVRESTPIRFLPWRSRRMLALFLAACAAMCLGVVSGATRKTALPHPLDAPPSIESAVFPAPVLSLIVATSVTPSAHQMFRAVHRSRQRLKRSQKARLPLNLKRHQTLSAKSAALPNSQQPSPERP